MLHTIKKLSLFAMFAVVAMAFAACSSDDDQPAILQQLLGSWKPISNCSSCGQSRVYETWYKDLTWDKHETIDGKDQRIRKGAFSITEDRIHLRNTCPKGYDVIEIDYKFEIKDNVLTLTNLKTKATTRYKRRN